MSKIRSVLFLVLILSYDLSAQVISPFNKLPIADSTRNYSFIVSGHFHGASYNLSTFPAASLQANIDTLNALRPSFLMSLGDLFLEVDETNMQHYQKSLFDKLQIPLFNAVGNHDLSNNELYEKVYGKTFFSFTQASELFIVLNTELNDGSIKGEQLTLLKDALQEASSEKIKNIFIFSHRPIWAEALNKYDKLFLDNTRSAFGKNNFSEELQPLLQQVSKNKNVFWISGSLGSAPASFFYDKDVETNVTYMQTAIRDLPRDAVLKVDVHQGEISLNGISLTGQELQAIEKYDINYWIDPTKSEEGINWKLLPYTIWMMISYRDFWIGLAFGLVLVFILSFLKKRWKKSE
jgi:hypothetical protein